MKTKVLVTFCFEIDHETKLELREAVKDIKDNAYNYANHGGEFGNYSYRRKGKGKAIK